MKNKLFLLIGIMMISVMAFSQVDFKNTSPAKIKVTSIDGLNSVEIFARETASISFLKAVNGMVRAKIQHSAYQQGVGFRYIDDGEFSLSVKNGVVVFDNPRQKQADASTTSTKKFGKWRVGTVSTPATVEKKTFGFASSIPVEKKTTNFGNSGRDISPFMNMQATFFVKNYCTMTITGYSGLLEGLCLKAKQFAKVKVTATTGLIQSAIGYDTDSDKVVTGANQKWAVLYKSIPEGLDTLKIYNENLVLVNTGVQVIKPFINRTPLGYLITNSKNQGVARNKTDNVSDITVAPNSTRKMKFYLGWNVKVFQYLDEEGLPRQAALLFLVTKDQRVVTLSKKSGSGNSISAKDLKIE